MRLKHPKRAETGRNGAKVSNFGWLYPLRRDFRSVLAE